MKKRHYIALAIVLAGVAACAWIILHPRQLPVEECGDVFQRYWQVDGVDASFMKDFPVNDTLRLDVTTLQARDSAGWEQLKKDFHLPELPEKSRKKIEKGIDVISIRYAPIADPTARMDTSCLLENNILGISRLYKTISIFHTHTEAEQDAIIDNQLNISL